MPDPPEDEGLNVVRRDEPEPHLIYGDLTHPEQPLVVESSRSSNVSTFAFVGMFILLVLAVIVVWVHFSAKNPEHRQPVIEQTTSTESSNSPAVSAPRPAASTKTIPVMPDMLRVTSIAMGKVPLAIVNGKRLAEGDWLEVKTEQGVATVQVEKIEDGVVHFTNGAAKIDAKLSTLPPRKDPH